MFFYKPKFAEQVCILRIKPPYVCNGCDERNKCTLEKTVYSAVQANIMAEQEISISRKGALCDEAEIARLNAFVTPLILNGQSVHQIYSPNSEDSVRIALAKIAYSTNCYNWVDKLTLINQIKEMANSSERQYLKGVIFYYKGLCLDKVSESVNYKDGAYFMCKSQACCFPLANIYLNYSKKLRNFEDDPENHWD